MNETEKKICPLLALSPSVQLNAKTYCTGEQCAWWCSGLSGISGACAVSMIAKSIYSIDIQGLEIYRD